MHPLRRVVKGGTRRSDKEGDMTTEDRKNESQTPNTTPVESDGAKAKERKRRFFDLRELWRRRSALTGRKKGRDAQTSGSTMPPGETPAPPSDVHAWRVGPEEDASRSHDGDVGAMSQAAQMNTEVYP